MVRAGRIALIFLFFALFTVGCTAGRKLDSFHTEPMNPIMRVAVLPVYNFTNDLDGPEMIRRLAVDRLRDRQYSVMEIDETDGLLKEQMGITLGTQLEMTRPVDLNEILNVDALLYTYLLEFDDLTLGVYNSRVVRAGFKLVDAKTGELLWSGGKGVRTVLALGTDAGALGAVGKTALDLTDDMDEYTVVKGLVEMPGIKEWEIIPVVWDNVEEAAILSLGTMVLGKVMGVHLKVEAAMVVDRTLGSIHIRQGDYEEERLEELEEPEEIDDEEGFDDIEEGFPHRRGHERDRDVWF